MLLLLGDESDTEFDNKFCFRALRVYVEALLRLGTVLLPLPGDDTDTDADGKE